MHRIGNRIDCASSALQVLGLWQIANPTGVLLDGTYFGRMRTFGTVLFEFEACNKL